jgi:ketosteroid isomerase-like protein
MDAVDAAQRWVDVWERAWPVADTAAIAGLYAEDAVFYSHPFRDRQAPADYVAWAFAEQASAECRFGERIAAGTRAAVDWWAVIDDRDGSQQTVAGTSLLRFREDGLVVEQRDAWGEAAGRRELPDWAP